MTSPRTSLDLNFDFQTTRVPFLWQPCILLTFYRSVKCFDKLFSTNLAALCQLDLFSVSSGGERILPLPDPDFNPPITTNSGEFLLTLNHGLSGVVIERAFQLIQAIRIALARQPVARGRVEKRGVGSQPTADSDRRKADRETLMPLLKKGSSGHSGNRCPKPRFRFHCGAVR